MMSKYEFALGVAREAEVLEDDFAFGAFDVSGFEGYEDVKTGVIVSECGSKIYTFTINTEGILASVIDYLVDNNLNSGLEMLEAGFDLDKLDMLDEDAGDDIVKVLDKELGKLDACYELVEALVSMFKDKGIDLLESDDLVVDVYETEITEMNDDAGDVVGYDVWKDFYDYYSVNEMNKKIDEGEFA